MKKKNGGGSDTLSEPALWERVGPEAVCFLRSVLAEMIKECVQPRHEKLPALPTVTRVIVEDSAILSMDERLADIYPGGTNLSSKRARVIRRYGQSPRTDQTSTM